MDVLFFAFANDRDNPLPNLEKEDELIYSLLAPRQAQMHFMIHRDSFADLGQITEYLTLYRKRIVLFHYSGHADGQGLFLGGEDAKARGIAELLAQCDRLKLVVLNGCSTQAQVQLLQEKNIPVVVATSAPIADNKAAEFAIQLYRSLANQENISEAYDAAKGKVLAMDDKVHFERSSGRMAATSTDPQASLWGLFQQAGMDETTQWSLPLGMSNEEQADFVPNSILIENLMEAFAPYNAEIRQMRENESLGVAANILDKREAALKCPPHPISEQIRKLLVPETGSMGPFYDKLGSARLLQMKTTYETIVEMMAFIMLGQLWDALSENPKIPIQPKLRELLQNFFRLTATQRRQYDFFPLIIQLRETLDEHDLSYFVPELKDLQGVFQPGEPFYEACQYFETLRKQVASAEPSENEAEIQCVAAEEQLGKVLVQLGFIALYTVASVKNIDVIKPRHLKTPKYKHTVVKLVQRFVGLAEEPELLEKFMDNTSVLLIREKDGQRNFMNLSPFVIDENAFDAKAPIAKLHYFDRYIREQDSYVFRHIYKPSDQPLLITKQLHYLVVKAQFDAFAQLLFQQNLQKSL